MAVKFNGGAFKPFPQTNKFRNVIRPTVYQSLTFDRGSVDEDGTTVVTCELYAPNSLEGTTVGYTISGVSVDDISLTSLTGVFTLHLNRASFTFTANADLITEGEEIMTITLDAADSVGNDTGSLSTALTINDTSITPRWFPSIATTGGTGTYYHRGDSSLSYDNNDNTYWGYHNAVYTNSTVRTYNRFPTPAPVTTLHVKLGLYVSPGYGNRGLYRIYYTVQGNSTWLLLWANDNYYAPSWVYPVWNFSMGGAVVENVITYVQDIGKGAPNIQVWDIWAQ